MDDKEFTRQLLELYPVMTVWARRYLEPGPEMEDFLQDVFLKAFSRRSQYDESRGTVKKWLSSILNNCYFDLFRKKKAQPLLISLEEPRAGILSLRTSEPTQVMYSECKEAERVLARQSEESQESFRLAILGYADYEITIRMKVPLGTTKARIRRTRAKILQELAFI